MLRVVSIILLFCLFSSNALPCSTYVSTKGSDDTGNGTYISPFYSLSKAVSTVDGANNTFVVCIEGGSYNDTKYSVKVNTSGLAVFRGIQTQNTSMPSNSPGWLLNATHGSVEVEGLSTTLELLAVEEIMIHNCVFTGPGVGLSVAGNRVFINSTSFHSSTLHANTGEIHITDSHLVKTAPYILSTKVNFESVEVSQLTRNIDITSVYTTLDSCTFSNNTNTANAGMFKFVILEGLHPIPGVFPGVRVKNSTFKNTKTYTTKIHSSDHYTISYVTPVVYSLKGFPFELEVTESTFQNNIVVFNNTNLNAPPFGVYVPDSTFYPDSKFYNSFINNNVDEKVSCSKGQASDSHILACESCDKGSYSNSTRATSCDLCPPGLHAPDYGMEMCIPCDNGYYTPNNGTVQCDMCYIGNIISSNGSMCTPCSAGTYQSGNECKKCVWMTSEAGATLCSKPGGLWFFVFVGCCGGVALLFVACSVIGCCTKKKKKGYSQIPDPINTTD